MATKVGVTEYGQRQRQESMQRANAAIDSITAQHAFDTKKTSLKRSYKQAQKQSKLLGARVTARAERYAKQTAGLSGLTRSVTATNTQAKRANQQWQQAIKSHSDQWQQDFLAKPRFQDLKGKARQKAWQKYYERQTKNLPEYTTIKALEAQGKLQYGQYTSAAAAAQRSHRQYEGMVKRQRQAYKRYEKALQRYNRFTRFVPYQP